MPLTHVVADGDCIESIAFRYGFHPQSLWKHASNEPLRTLRPNPHVLAPGDEVQIPDRTAKTVDAATGLRHRFRRCGVPAKLRLRLEDAGEPLASVGYTLQVDRGAAVKGTTDADGHLEAWIAPDAKSAVLTLEEGGVYSLGLGRLRPDDFRAGVISRLRNLGYDVDDDETILEAALLLFQHDQELEETGEPDDATVARLIELHRS